MISMYIDKFDEALHAFIYGNVGYQRRRMKSWIHGPEFISTKSENGQKLWVLYFNFFLMYLPVVIVLVIIDYDIDSYAYLLVGNQVR